VKKDFFEPRRGFTAFPGRAAAEKKNEKTARGTQGAVCGFCYFSGV